MQPYSIPEPIFRSPSFSPRKPVPRTSARSGISFSTFEPCISIQPAFACFWTAQWNTCALILCLGLPWYSNYFSAPDYSPDWRWKWGR
ncbi:hypothetical protein BDQ12DRAFT_674434 [Crucibulum laeve]|uniref:Uncharacterized protein n=1 Tax=Crucibulum laeve TaxID=68775 RepID=A0A5C3MGS9_9AGAR|nr:hypothetical protein BDQ12DRAFT_674434 [Crucibulum laeve]